MAVSSTSSSTSSATTNSIDVAGIVSQLMTYESKPLDAIKAQLSNQSAVISDLGTIKSKMATFQDAIQAFQDANTFKTVQDIPGYEIRYSFTKNIAGYPKWSLRFKEGVDDLNEIYIFFCLYCLLLRF
jgi:hypothetical protein